MFSMYLLSNYTISHHTPKEKSHEIDKNIYNEEDDGRRKEYFDFCENNTHTLN